MKTTITLTITVDFETNGVPVEELKNRMERVAQNAAGEGWFTGDTEAEVDTWDSTVETK